MNTDPTPKPRLTGPELEAFRLGREARRLDAKAERRPSQKHAKRAPVATWHVVSFTCRDVPYPHTLGRTHGGGFCCIYCGATGRTDGTFARGSRQAATMARKARTRARKVGAR